MVKDNSDSERENPMLFPRSSKGSFICIIPRTEGVRCSSVVRAFAHCAMGRRIDPPWWSH